MCQQEKRNFWKGDYIKFGEKLDSFDLETDLRSSSVEEVWMKSRTNILINDHVPLMKQRKAR